METSDLVLSLEAELRLAARLLILPAAGECLACYVARMLGEFGCTGSRWVLHYRDLRTPRATALVRRLQDMGVYCDCQMFQNAWRPSRSRPAPNSSIASRRVLNVKLWR